MTQDPSSTTPNPPPSRKAMWAAAWLCASLTIAPQPIAAQHQVTVEGVPYEIVDGNVYEVDGADLRHVMELYDPTHLDRSYTEIDGVIHRIVPSDSTTYPTLEYLSGGFDEMSDIVSGIGPHTGWTSLNLQSPYAPNVADYVALWQRIARGEDTCHDNCVALAEVDGEVVLRATAVAANRRSDVSKALLESGLLHVTQGDSLRVSANFRIDEGMPVSLLDFESTYMQNGPGFRVMLTEEGVPWVQLKWGDRPRWMPDEAVSVPRGDWFNLTLEVDVAHEDGHVRLWLDDVLLIDGMGQTLHLPDAVLDRMQVGITAAVSGPTTVLVNDFEFRELDG